HTPAAESWRWNSPIPYLFGGLSALLGLIALALLILACIYHKSSRNNDDIEKLAKPALQPPEIEVQKFVVIMAGDNNPTYLAKPVSNASHQTLQVV
ncbi:hypothetical protein GIB67_015870, partial [Kingdonia uniflora]